MAISEGLYRIGSVPYPGEDGSYANILDWRNDIAAALTGDMTAMVTSDSTSTNTPYFHNKNLGSNTLLIDNTIDRSIPGNALRAENKLVFDSTTNKFQGIYLRQDSAGDGTVIIRNQYFKRINATEPTGNQEADIYLAGANYHYHAQVYNNTFDSPDGPDGSAWYCIWMSSSAHNTDSLPTTVEIFNNIFNGYKYSMICQNYETGDMTATISNCVEENSSGGYLCAYARNLSIFYNNVGNQFGVNNNSVDTTGYSNISIGSTAGNFHVGTNYPATDVATQYDSITFGDPNFYYPNIQEGSITMHKGTSDGLSSHDRYLNSLPIIPDDVQIGAFGLRTPPPIMDM